MKNRVFLLAVYFSAYFQKAKTEEETVWLKDITTLMQTEKRTLSDPYLPDQLYFLLKRKSHGMTLNLKRNYRIDPNVNIYTMPLFQDGRPKLEKTHLVKKDVAYYQDIENGAFMTARCVKRSSGQCDILINGNIRIGDRMYDLQPSEAHVTSRNFMERTSLLGKQYVLQDQGNIQRNMAVENKEETNVNENKEEEVLTDRHRLISDEEDRQNHFLHPDVKLLTRNFASLHKAFATGENSHNNRTNIKNDEVRNRRNYYVEVVVLTDSSIYDRFLAMAVSATPFERDIEAKIKIKNYFSHVINGVDMLYRGIKYSGIRIGVILRALVILQTKAQFPHVRSSVHVYDVKKLIDVNDYITDLGVWDNITGSTQLPAYDQIILFTKYDLYEGIYADLLHGLSNIASVCETGLRVQLNRVDHYFLTVTLAAHELGHALGAEHDGDGKASSCSPDDRYIMTPDFMQFELNETNFMNPCIFSSCSVKSFIKTLRKKNCTTSKGAYSQAILNEWAQTMMNQPGEVLTLNEQCSIIFGNGSTYCVGEAGMICRFMRCTLPWTGKCCKSHLTAAIGTPCGQNHWCSSEALCVPKGS